MRYRTDERGGIALLLAFLVLLILISVIGAMVLTGRHTKTVAENHVADLQNTYGVRGGYERALLLLQDDLERGAEVDALHERWASPLSIGLGKAQVQATTVDCERFVNLGKLVDDKGEAVPAVADQLRRLVRILRHPPDTADRIIDYVDADRKGAYELRSRNEPLMNAEELLRVEGLKPEILYGGDSGGDVRKGLLEFVTVWPRAGKEAAGAEAKINVNTAPPEVLEALADEMSPQAAQAIVAWRMQPGPDQKPQGFKSIEEVKNVPGIPAAVFETISKALTVTSTTFEVRVRSSVGNVEKAWVYVVKRSSGAAAPQPGQPPPSGGKVTLLSSQRLNDFLTVKPPEELRD